MVGALRDLGYEPEVHGAEGAALVGYRGDERSERAADSFTYTPGREALRNRPEACLRSVSI